MSGATVSPAPAGGGPLRSASPNHGCGPMPVSSTATTGRRCPGFSLRYGGSAARVTGIRLAPRVRP